ARRPCRIQLAEELTGIRTGAEQRLDLGAQLGIATASFGEIRLPLGGRRHLGGLPEDALQICDGAMHVASLSLFSATFETWNCQAAEKFHSAGCASPSRISR